MKRSRIWSVLALLVCFAVDSLARSQPSPLPETPPIDTELARRLIAAPTVALLDYLYQQSSGGDVAIRAIYRQRRLEMEPSSAEELRFLRALPKTEEELSRVYSLSNSPDIGQDPTVIKVVYDMFSTAAELVHKHGKFHKEFIHLVYMTDGELGEVAWPAYDELLNRDARRTLAALRELPVDVGKTICNGADPKALSPREAQEKCHSEL